MNFVEWSTDNTPAEKDFESTDKDINFYKIQLTPILKIEAKLDALAEKKQRQPTPQIPSSSKIYTKISTS